MSLMFLRSWRVSLSTVLAPRAGPRAGTTRGPVQGCTLRSREAVGWAVLACSLLGDCFLSSSWTPAGGTWVLSFAFLPRSLALTRFHCQQQEAQAVVIQCPCCPLAHPPGHTPAQDGSWPAVVLADCPAPRISAALSGVPLAAGTARSPTCTSSSSSAAETSVSKGPSILSSSACWCSLWCCVDLCEDERLSTVFFSLTVWQVGACSCWWTALQPRAAPRS